MKNFTTLLALVLLATLFTTCKKGEEDPAFSLRTRKARLTGDWIMTEGSASITYFVYGAPYNDAFKFDGSNLTLNSTESTGPPTIYVGKYSLSLSFKKDGTFTASENFAGKPFNANGTWNFTSGVGKAKNKDGIVMKISGVSSGTSDDHLFNQLGMQMTYKLVELRNKEIKLQSDVDLYKSFEDKEYTTYSSQYTFRAK